MSYLPTKFHFRYNIDRKFHDLENIDKNLAIKANYIHPNLNNLNWITKNEEPNNEEILKMQLTRSVMKKEKLH